MTNLEQAVKDLQDNLVVLAEIERRQSSMLLEHSERLVTLENQSTEFRSRIEQNFERFTKGLDEIREFQKHSDQRLDALIHVVDDLVRKRPPQ